MNDIFLHAFAQALAQNRVVRTDLGLAQDPTNADHSTDNFSSHEGNGIVGGGEADGTSCCNSGATSTEGAEGTREECRPPPLGDASMRPLGPEILDAAVDALCCLLAPGGAVTSGFTVGGSVVRQGNTGVEGGAAGGSEGGSTGTVGGGVADAGRGSGVPFSVISPSPCSSSRPRRHHLVLRLCGKVLASLAPSAPRATLADGGQRPLAADKLSSGWAMGAVMEPVEEGDEEEAVPAAACTAADPVVPAAAAAPSPVAIGDAFDERTSLPLIPRSSPAKPEAAPASDSDSVTDSIVDQERREEYDEERSGTVADEGHARCVLDTGDPECVVNGEGEATVALGEGAESRGREGGGRRETVLRRIGDAHAAAAAAVLEGMGDAEGASIVAFEEEVRRRGLRG